MLPAAFEFASRNHPSPSSNVCLILKICAANAILFMVADALFQNGEELIVMLCVLAVVLNAIEGFLEVGTGLLPDVRQI